MHVSLDRDHAWDCLLVGLKSSHVDGNSTKDLGVPSATNSDISKVVPDRVEIFSDFVTDTRVP